jgi:hypothetical protein
MEERAETLKTALARQARAALTPVHNDCILYTMNDEDKKGRVWILNPLCNMSAYGDHLLLRLTARQKSRKQAKSAHSPFWKKHDIYHPII